MMPIALIKEFKGLKGKKCEWHVFQWFCLSQEVVVVTDKKAGKLISRRQNLRICFK